jgi:D-beta-D-heptose 7-phosphate kinase/D-beta-D-heptose 1-phosphate adenosyltransferase
LLKELKPAQVLVAGDVMVDEYVLGAVDRISPESPVPVLVVTDRLRRLGGAGNVVKNLVSLGGGVALLATVGKDQAGDWFRRHCEEMAVETFWLKESAGRPTTIKTRVVARNQQIVRIDEEVVGEISPETEIAVISDVKALVPQVGSIVLSDYGKGFLTERIIRAIISEAKGRGVPVLVDPKGRDYTKYRGASYLTPNRKEASLASGVRITDSRSLDEAGRALIEQTDAEAVLITRGREGATLVTKTESKDFPVNPVEIIDVTGAGDTVIAAMALCVANGFALADAIRFANIAASIVVSRFGAASVTVDDIRRAVKNQSPRDKTVRKSEIASLLSDRRVRGDKVVFTNGCFDLLHAGHLQTLRQAAKLGDVLVVGVNSDHSVKRLKGAGRPIIPQTERVELVSALEFVDHVVVFDEDTPIDLIMEVRPDVLVKGEDWEGKGVVGEDFVRSRGGVVRFVKRLDGISTTDLIKKIRGGSREGEYRGLRE